MFSSFKNIVNNSLQELDRLGDSSFGLPQQQQEQQQRQQQYQQQQRGHNGYHSSASPTFSSRSLNENQLHAASIPAGSRRSPNMHARGGPVNSSDGRSSPLSFANPLFSNNVPARTNSPGLASPPSTSSARPMSSSSTATATSGKNHDRRESTEIFPDFGFSNLKRSLSGMNKASLDLTGIRSSFDAGRPSTSAGTPSTPGKELPRADVPGSTVARRPSLSISGGGRKRKSSARSFSMSGLTGVYTPDTMMRQDPFFFTALQALPDELKLAAFTPLPTEDDDEYLEGIDHELNTKASTFPSTLPQLSTNKLYKSMPPSFSGPASAPAAGFMRPPFSATPPAIRTPLVEVPQGGTFGRLEDHPEVEERASAQPSPQPTPKTSPHSRTGTAAEPLGAAATSHDQITQSEVGQRSSRTDISLGLDLPPSATFRSTSTEPILQKNPERTTSLQSPPLVVPSQSLPGSRSASPVPPPKHESLQARLARLAKSRSQESAHQASTVQAAVAETSLHAVQDLSSNQTPSLMVEAHAGEKVENPRDLSTLLPDKTSRASFENDTPLRQSFEAPRADNQIDSGLESLLKQYMPDVSLADLGAVEKFLQQRNTSMSTQSNFATETSTNASAAGSKQAQKDQVTIAALEAELKEARASVTRADAKAKEEEDKKSKSISLLKAVRQKLLKAEKDKEDAEVIRDALRASEEGLQSELRQRTQRFESELLSTRTNQEREIARLRASFDREANLIRGAAEREAAAKRGQFELDLLTQRSAHTRELQLRDARINTLETSLRDLRREKDNVFEQLQSKQAEVESATSSQERVQVAYDEMQYELRESRDRVSALQEEVLSFKKARLDQTRDEGHTRRLLAELESSNADKIQTFEDRIRTLEKERLDIEEGMTKKLQEKLREVEKLRREIERRDAENSEETQRREERQQRIERAEKQNLALQDKVNALDMLLNEARLEISRIKEEHSTTQELLADQHRRVAELEGRNDDLSAKEGQLRITNKSLREELRKVQAGILLSERSRNPGVGYFSSFAQSGATSPAASTVNLATPGAKSPPPMASPLLGGNANGSVSSGMERQSSLQSRRDSTTSLVSEGAVARAGATGTGSEEEALNFEYIRNVILQFLEHKEMRPHLVSVLGVILHFTPAETRRLTSKASA